MKSKDLAIANSRPEGGNEYKTNRYHQYLKELESFIQSQWKDHKPQWFITIQWTPAPYAFQVASGHAKHFRNRLLASIYSCPLKKLPRPQERCRLIWFHERAEDQEGRLIYHSHLHLGQLPAPYKTRLRLNWIIDTQVAPGFKCLKHLHRRRDPAIIIKSWNQDHHANYNLKDYYSYKHHQDADLVLDYAISDLITTK
jgi:hypothetical protein